MLNTSTQSQLQLIFLYCKTNFLQSYSLCTVYSIYEIWHQEQSIRLFILLHILWFVGIIPQTSLTHPERERIILRSVHKLVHIDWFAVGHGASQCVLAFWSMVLEHLIHARAIHLVRPKLKVFDETMPDMQPLVTQILWTFIKHLCWDGKIAHQVWSIICILWDYD